MLQFVMQTCSKSVDFVDNKFGQSICNESVDNLQQLDLLLTSCRKSRERICISRCCKKLLQDVNKTVATSSLTLWTIVDIPSKGTVQYTYLDLRLRQFVAKLLCLSYNTYYWHSWEAFDRLLPRTNKLK